MTHLSQDLNRICRDWCPLVDMCGEEHECGNRIKLKRIIWEIAGKNDEED